MEKGRGNGSGLAGACMLAVCMVALAVVEPPFLNRWEEICRDVVQRLVPPASSEHSCVIVAVDAKSRREVGPWPWPGKTAGRLVELIARGNPRAIGIVSCPASSDGSAALPDAVRSAGNVVAGFRFRRAGLSSTPAPPAPEVSRIRRVTNPWGKARAYAMPAVEGTECLDATLSGAAAGAGFSNAFPSGPARVVREAPLVCADGSGYYRSFAVALACVAAGAERVTLRLKGDAVDGIEIDGRMISTDARGRLRLRVRAGGGGPMISASDVLLGNFEPGRWAGKIVLVGECEARVPARVLGRLPADAPPVLLNATAVGSLVRGDYLRRSRLAAIVERVLVALFPFIAWGVFGRGGRAWLTWGLLAALLAGCAGTAGALAAWGVETRPFYPALSAIVSWAVFGTLEMRVGTPSQ